MQTKANDKTIATYQTPQGITVVEVDRGTAIVLAVNSPSALGDIIVNGQRRSVRIGDRVDLEPGVMDDVEALRRTFFGTVFEPVAEKWWNGYRNVTIRQVV